MTRYVNRRRLGRPYKRGDYASNMGLVAVPFRRRRPPPTITTTGISGGPQLRMGFRVRTSGRTQTKTKRKRRFGGAVTHGDNASSSYSIMGSRKYASFYINRSKSLGVHHLIETDVATLESYQGTQGIFMLPALLDRADCQTVSNQISTVNRSTTSLLLDGKSVFHIRNATSNLCKLRIYEIWTIRNPPKTDLHTPQRAWYDGNTDSGLPTITVGAVTLNYAHKIDSTPFGVRDFSRYYKIHKVTSVHLEAGQQHNHTIKHNIYKRMKREVWEDNPEETGFTTIGGFTRHFMIVWQGGLTHDTTAALLPNLPAGIKSVAGEVTCSAIRLDVSVEHRFRYMFDSVSTERFTSTGNVKVNVADEDFMGETGDADRNPDMA